MDEGPQLGLEQLHQSVLGFLQFLFVFLPLLRVGVRLVQYSVGRSSENKCLGVHWLLREHLRVDQLLDVAKGVLELARAEQHSEEQRGVHCPTLLVQPDRTLENTDNMSELAQTSAHE